MHELAPILALTLQSVEISDRKDIDEAFAAITRDRAEGVIVDSDPINATNRERIVEFAAANRLPAIYVSRKYVDSGGLMSYGPSFYELWRRAAIYVDKILKGASPADLPVEQPTVFAPRREVAHWPRSPRTPLPEKIWPRASFDHLVGAQQDRLRDG